MTDGVTGKGAGGESRLEARCAIGTTDIVRFQKLGLPYICLFGTFRPIGEEESREIKIPITFAPMVPRGKFCQPL